MVYVTHEARDYKAEVARRCAARGITQPLQGRIALAIRLFPHRPQDWARRARNLGATWDDDVRCIDLDNANKVLLDALKGIAFEDDKWVRRLQAERMEPDEHGARVIVAIEQLAIEQPQGDLLQPSVARACAVSEVA
jgi:crossover junction endodeoxyribonuclease RusA